MCGEWLLSHCSDEDDLDDDEEEVKTPMKKVSGAFVLYWMHVWPSPVKNSLTAEGQFIQTGVASAYTAYPS